MRILSWNIQFGKSSSDNYDLLQTLGYIHSLGEFDVICLQELARNMEEYSAPGQSDQLAIALQHFPSYTPVWGAGFSWASASGNRSDRQEFGNLSLVRSEPLDYRVHQLPQPATPGKKQMQRVAIETVVNSEIGPLSIINTHLAFHDSNEAQQQLEKFNWLEQERIAHHRFPKQMGIGTYQEGFLPTARILCGDFNFTPDTTHYQYQLDNDWIDAWRQGHVGGARLPTCGIFDTRQWPEGPHCRDYFWLSIGLAKHDVTVEVDTCTDLSDHQPIILTLAV